MKWLPQKCTRRSCTGVSVTVDTDGTGENVTTWFGDIHFDARAIH